MTTCRITVTPHGPLRVEGSAELTDRDGNAYPSGGRRTLALCRCGNSGQRPFCDGSHGSCGFRDEGAARDLPLRQLEHSAGTGAAGCRIIVNPNGALRVEGTFQLVDCTGQSFGLAGRASIALCRCGGSKSRPFCDGAHQTCGFRDAGVASGQ